jgi:hypothetical protein
MARVDPSLLDTLRGYDLFDRIRADHLYDTMDEAMGDFRSDAAARGNAP